MPSIAVWIVLKIDLKKSEPNYYTVQLCLKYISRDLW